MKRESSEKIYQPYMVVAALFSDLVDKMIAILMKKDKLKAQALLLSDEVQNLVTANTFYCDGQNFQIYDEICQAEEDEEPKNPIQDSWIRFTLKSTKKPLVKVSVGLSQENRHKRSFSQGEKSQLKSIECSKDLSKQNIVKKQNKYPSIINGLPVGQIIPSKEQKSKEEIEEEQKDNEMRETLIKKRRRQEEMINLKEVRVKQALKGMINFRRKVHNKQYTYDNDGSVILVNGENKTQNTGGEKENEGSFLEMSFKVTPAFQERSYNDVVKNRNLIASSNPNVSSGNRGAAGDNKTLGDKISMEKESIPRSCEQSCFTIDKTLKNVFNIQSRKPNNNESWRSEERRKSKRVEISAFILPEALEGPEKYNFTFGKPRKLSFSKMKWEYDQGKKLSELIDYSNNNLRQTSVEPYIKLNPGVSLIERGKSPSRKPSNPLSVAEFLKKPEQTLDFRNKFPSVNNPKSQEGLTQSKIRKKSCDKSAVQSKDIITFKNIETFRNNFL